MKEESSLWTSWLAKCVENRKLFKRTGWSSFWYGLLNLKVYKSIPNRKKVHIKHIVEIWKVYWNFVPILTTASIKFPICAKPTLYILGLRPFQNSTIWKFAAKIYFLSTYTLTLFTKGCSKGDLHSKDYYYSDFPDTNY